MNFSLMNFYSVSVIPLHKFKLIPCHNHHHHETSTKLLPQINIQQSHNHHHLHHINTTMIPCANSMTRIFDMRALQKKHAIHTTPRVTPTT